MKRRTNGHKPATPGVTRAVVYRRTSSERQGERVSPEAQLTDCEAHAHSKGYTVVGVYTDVERYRSRGRLVEPSGTRLDRPDFQRMIADGQAGKYDVIIAWKEDRLYRGVKPAVPVGDLLEETGITVELVKETFDPKMVFIKAAIGKLEIESIRERTEMGMKARMRDGMIHGGPVPAGYIAIKGEDGTAKAYVFDPAWRPFFDDLARYYIARLPLAEICRRLGTDPRSGRPWNDANLSMMLRNPFYRGQIAYGWQKGDPEFTVRGRHESPWNAETIAAVEREQARRGGRHNAPRSRALLSGILRCGVCGYPMACGMSYPAGRQAAGYRWYGCNRPVYVRQGKWHGRRTHAPNYINELRALELLRAMLAEIEPGQVDDFLSAISASMGGAAPDDGQRNERLQAEAKALREKLDDLSVGLEGVRHASPSATEAIVSAITATGKQLDRVRADLGEVTTRRTTGPDLEAARQAMLRLIAKPKLLERGGPQLQGLLQSAFPALYVAAGAIVSPVIAWKD